MSQSPVRFVARLPIGHWASTPMMELAGRSHVALAALKPHAKLSLGTIDHCLCNPVHFAFLTSGPRFATFVAFALLIGTNPVAFAKAFLIP